MNLNEWKEQIPLQEEEVFGNEAKLSGYLDWDVVRESPDFPDFWGDKNIVDWVVVQYKNKKWKSIGYYKSISKSSTKIYFLIKADPYQKEWIREMSPAILRRYDDGVLTLRGLHYKMVGLGMINSLTHYKRVVNAMIDARREGVVRYAKFSDRDRQMESETKWELVTYEDQVDQAFRQVKAWMRSYTLNMWENQPYYPELWIEKKALIGVFEAPCKKHKIALAACKGYPSLTFLYEASKRFQKAVDEGKKPVLIYFGDYDPSGEDIPRAIKENFENDFDIDIEVKRMALTEEQVEMWELPPAPVKPGDTRSATWDGLGQVELDAVEVDDIEALIESAVEDIFDEDLYQELMDREESESEDFVVELKDKVKNMNLD